MAIGAAGLAHAEEEEAYPGPVLEFTALETIYSEQGVVKYKMATAQALHYENGDREYPQGVEVVFYEADKRISATARANRVYYVAQEDTYEFRGDVEIKSLSYKTQLNTEALHWKPGTETFHTDKFIRIETEDKLLTGEGLTAKQDLIHYRIERPQGIFKVKSIFYSCVINID